MSKLASHATGDPAMMSPLYPMLHPLVRWLGRRCLRWFYRERCVLGRVNIPATGPVLLIGNHPNDIPDSLLGYLSTHRPVRYVGTISGADTPTARATYRGLGVIPVARIRDARKQRELGVDIAATNEAAFQSVTAALTAGDMVAVFPEGGVVDEPSMGHFRSGVAKMALDCAVNGAKTGVSIVPIGVHYDAPNTARTDVTVVIGTSFALDLWVEGYHARRTIESPAPQSAQRENTLLAIALRHRMREALLMVTRNAPTWEQAHARDRLAALVGALHSTSEITPLAAAAAVQHACAEFLNPSNPGSADADFVVDSRLGVAARNNGPRDEIVRLADDLSSTVARAGGLAQSPRDCARVLHAAGVQSVAPAWPSLFVIVVSAPFAFVGLAVHAPMLAVIWRRARRIAADRAELVGKAFVSGIFHMVAWYAALGVTIAIALDTQGVSAWYALLVVTVLPRLGDLGLWWNDAVTAWWLRARVRQLPTSERDRLCAAADSLREAWRAGDDSWRDHERTWHRRAAD